MPLPNEQNDNWSSYNVNINDELEVLDQNGSMYYVQDQHGNTDWVDYREVDGWRS